MHPNAELQRLVERRLGRIARVRLTPPLPYWLFIRELVNSYLALTDSGGLQEEGPALGKPVLVMRDVTERPEGVEAGAVRLVGTSTSAVVSAVNQLLDDADAYRAMARIVSVYGDG